MGLFSRLKSQKGSNTKTQVPSNGHINGKARPGVNGGMHGKGIMSETVVPVKEAPLSPEIDGEVPPAPDPAVDAPGYLRSIQAVRERCMIVYDKAKKNELNHFDVDWDKLDETVHWVQGIVKVGLKRLPLSKLYGAIGC